ncbi:sensor histidine kinase [Nocardia pneumoniae]|uniref:sensor histidine kinase n=1 Tax=Nocardia pneumoniae TaxID=228601 RepID=UPI0002F59FE1|nr:HAMP domain-containing sensor histidine kinase [Nocardia pneumoniae]
MRMLSLRTRVALATALGAVITVTALAGFLSVAVARSNVRQLDGQLDTAARLLELNADTARQFLGHVDDAGAAAVTIRENGIVTSSTTRLPELPDGYALIDIDGARYRVKTVTVPREGHSVSISVALPIKRAQAVTRRQQRRVLVTGAVAVLIASSLGWYLGGRAVLPLVDLTHRISQGAPTPDLTGTDNTVREASELSAAIAHLLTCITDAQGRTHDALETARTFAATAGHELRGPLTAMRTDLEVMRGLDLPREQRTHIIDDILRKQSGIESTLTALEQLASGELDRHNGNRITVDLVDIADEAARDARRHHPDLVIDVCSEPPLPFTCLPSGIRLALDNAITNAVRHGRATTVHLTARRNSDRVTIIIDDNGVGIPDDERDAVFARFYRGSNAEHDGSGLGLALIAQQAELHHGHTHFTDSPLGGARLVMDITDRHIGPTGKFVEDPAQ